MPSTTTPMTEPDDDEILARLSELRDEARSNFQRLKSKQNTDPAMRELVDTVMSLFADFTGVVFEAFLEQREWAAAVEAELDELEGPDGSVLQPEDAERLTTLLLDLKQNLRAAESSEDPVNDLAKRTDDMIMFVNNVTAAVEEDDEIDTDTPTEPSN